METTAEKLLCDSTICLQQIAATTQKLYWILLYLVLIEFALEKLFFKKRRSFKSINTAISALRERFPDSTFCEQACVLGILGMKNFVKLVPRCISERCNKKTSQGRIFPSLVSKQRRLFSSSETHGNLQLVQLFKHAKSCLCQQKTGQKENPVCVALLSFAACMCKKPSHSELWRLKCRRENRIILHLF